MYHHEVKFDCHRTELSGITSWLNNNDVEWCLSPNGVLDDSQKLAWMIQMKHVAKNALNEKYYHIPMMAIVRVFFKKKKDADRFEKECKNVFWNVLRKGTL